MSETKPTSRDIQDALRVYYPSGEWAIAFEVGNSTGFQCSRHADAVAMSLWPSRGLAIHGVEIKVSKTDFKKELETPEKADAVARYCDYWWVAAPKGLLHPDALPLSWGLLEFNGSIKVKKQAKELEALSIDRRFCGALFRAVVKEDEYRLNKAVEKRTVDVHRLAEESVENAVKRREEEIREAKMALRKIEMETGIPIDDLRWRDTSFIEAVKKVLNHQEPPTYRIKSMVNAAERFAAELKQLLEIPTK